MRTLLISIGVAALAGFVGGYGLRDLQADAAEKKRVEKVHTVYVDRVVKGAAAATKAQEAITKVEYRTRTIIKEVPKYVTPETDRSFPIPLGLVRVHDSAALGQPAPAPSESDGTASAVTASELASTLGDNYGTCYVWREQLIGLQEWARGMATRE